MKFPDVVTFAIQAVEQLRSDTDDAAVARLREQTFSRYEIGQLIDAVAATVDATYRESAPFGGAHEDFCDCDQRDGSTFDEPTGPGGKP